jgi:hypothetical protein
MVLEPSTRAWQRVEHAIQTHKRGDYDMEIVNQPYSTSAMILPHRPYALLTRAFLTDDAQEHARYLGNTDEAWDPRAALDEAKYVHFSDWPAPKPWVNASGKEMQDVEPKCREVGGVTDCGDRAAWVGLRREFRSRRKVCCNWLFPSMYGCR